MRNESKSQTSSPKESSKRILYGFVVFSFLLILFAALVTFNPKNASRMDPADPCNIPLASLMRQAESTAAGGGKLLQLPVHPAPGLFSDELNDWNLIHERSANMILAGEDADLRSGDSSRAKPGGSGFGELVWRHLGFSEAAAVLYYPPGRQAEHVLFCISPDGSAWKRVLPEMETAMVGWIQFTCRLSNLAGANYLKIRWINSDPDTAPELGRIALSQ